MAAKTSIHDGVLTYRACHLSCLESDQFWGKDSPALSVSPSECAAFGRTVRGRHQDRLLFVRRPNKLGHPVNFVASRSHHFDY